MLSLAIPIYNMHFSNQQIEQQALDVEREQLSNLLASIIQKHVPADTWNWFKQQSLQTNNPTAFNAAFAIMPRKLGKKAFSLSEEDERVLNQLVPGFKITDWSIDRLCRVWLLMHLNTIDREEYKKRVENLFRAADMNELIALYSSLPLLAYGEMWSMRCAEGMRSNIDDVLHAIICNNPYPSAYLGQSAWNQLVLKAFFTNKPIDQIIGLDDRTNTELATILIDYAHERYAAHRTVNPQLWRCVSPYINKANFMEVIKLLQSKNEAENEAGALACWHSNYLPAKDLLTQYPDLKERIGRAELTWQSIAFKPY